MNYPRTIEFAQANSAPAHSGTTRKRKETVMAKRHEVFPTRFLTAADLNGKPITLTIERAPLEVLKNKTGEETKTVLYFRGTKKSLPLNRVNWDSCADICGDDSDDWSGCRIEVFPTTTQFAADTVACVRIRAPAQGELKPPRAAKRSKAQPGEEMDDAVPFRQ
jgi:hypothetical protein